MWKKYGLLLEIGNSKTNFALFNFQGKLLKRNSFLSYIYFGSETQYIGHFNLNDADFTIGTIAMNLRGAKKVVDIPSGKSKYFIHFVCAAIVHVRELLDEKSDIEIYLSFVSLVNLGKKKFQSLLDDIRKLVIDDVEYKIRFFFDEFYMEGIGGIYPVLEKHKNEKYVSSADLGDGTTILKTYEVVKGYMRSSSGGVYEDLGTNSLVKLIVEYSSLKIPSMSVVNKKVLYDSLFNNKYEYRHDDIVENIREEAKAACYEWLGILDAKEGFVVQIRSNIKDSIYTQCIGGGWNMEVLKESLREKILDKSVTQDVIDKYLLFSDKSRSIGFDSLCSGVVSDNKNRFSKTICREENINE